MSNARYTTFKGNLQNENSLTIPPFALEILTVRMNKFKVELLVMVKTILLQIKKL